MGITLTIFGVVGLVGSIIYVSWLQEKKRKEAMQAAAMALGFTYSEDSGWDDFLDLPIFERGRAKQGKNVLKGQTAGHPVTLVDYQYTVGSGKNSQTHRQTVALFGEAGKGLPDFELSPENFLHRIGQVFGYQDIDFDTDEEFSKKFLLRGVDEAGIRDTFNDSVRAACGNFTEWTIQVRGGRVAAFRASKRCDPSEIPSFLANGLRIVSALGARS